MAFTKKTVIQRVRVVLNDNPFTTTCAEAMDTTETGLDVPDGTLWNFGDIVEFQDDGEQCYVTAVASNTLTVIRAFNSTTVGTGTAHAINEVIVQNPVFVYNRIEESIAATLRDLWPYVYKKVTETLTPLTDGNKWYDMVTSAATIIDLSSVVQVKGTGASSTIKNYGTPDHPVSLQFNLPTAKVASGVGLYIPRRWDSTNSIIVNGIAKLTAGVTTTTYDDISEGQQVDCVVYLSVARLLGATDVTRTTQEDVSMGEATVSSGARTRIAEYWRNLGIDLRTQWEWELRRTLPRMRRHGHGRTAF